MLNICADFLNKINGATLNVKGRYHLFNFGMKGIKNITAGTRCRHIALRVYLADPVEDCVVVAGAEALDDGREDDRHERLRHSVGHRRHCADRHQHRVGAVGIAEHPQERHFSRRRRCPLFATRLLHRSPIPTSVSRCPSHQYLAFLPPRAFVVVSKAARRMGVLYNTEEERRGNDVRSIVTGFGVDASSHDPGTPFRFEGRGRRGSVSHSRLDRIPV